MDQFSLDDARETFAADIGAALAAVAAAARGLGALPPLAAPLAAGAGSGQLGAIADACHAMRGTASLLSVAPVASGAGLLAELAREAAAALTRLAGDGARLRAIHAALLAGGEAMRAILALELDKRRNASEVALAGFAATVRRALAPPGGATGAFLAPTARHEADEESLLVVVTDTERYTSPAAPPAGAAPSAPGEFDFSAPTAAAAPPASLLPALPPEEADAGDEGTGFDFAAAGAPPADFAAELCGIFRQEAAEFLPELRRHLEALAADSRDRRAARELQRIYHTLKGASATAGLPAVSDLARTLEDAVEQVLAGRAGDAGAQVQRLLAHTNDLLKASGLAEIAVVVVDRGEHPSESASSIFYLRNAGDPSAQLLNVFCLESALTLGAVRHTQRVLRQAEPGSAAWDAQRQELARLFHLLKGSAVVANQGDVANRAAALQGLCRRRAVDLDLAARLAEGIAGLSTGIDLAMAAAGLGATTPPGTGAVHAKAPAGSGAVPAPAAPVREQVPAIGDPQLWEALTLEAAELLQGIDRAAVALVDSQRPQRELEELFRAVHTLKGALTTVGVAPLGRYLHRVEDLLAALQDATILPPLRGIAALAAEVLGTVRANLELIPRGWVEIDHARLESGIHALLAAPSAPVAAGAAPSSLAATAQSSRQGSGTSAAAATASSGDVAGDQAGRRFVRVPAERLDGLMNLTGELVVSRSRIGKRIDGLRHMQRDLLERKDRLLETIGTFRERYEFSRARVQPRPLARPPAGRAAGKAAAGPPAPVPRRPARGGALTAHFSDIELDRYEDINILSRSLAEIGDDIAMLHGQFAGACRGIAEDVTAFGGSIGSLQAEITRTRMVAIDVLFARMRLPMHDAAAREAKEVRLEVAGGEVALDKAIVDGLGGALMHLVRNAVSHGVESPARRAAAGKERGGVITLGARQDAGQVVVTIADDGAGLDLAALHRRGVERGLIAAETALDDPAVRELVFAPGLSTRAEVGPVAGRGVGCDAVRREVERLGGHVAVASAAGHGTTFTIVLPLTLAIARALLVRAGGAGYAIPLAFTERIAEPGELPESASAGHRRVRVEGAWVPLRSLAEVLRLPTTGAAQVVIVLRVGESRTALTVDAVLGQEEIVVKRLEHVLAGHPLFSGMTIDADGAPVLILDAPGLVGHGGARGEALPAPGAAPAAARSAEAVAAPAGPRVLFVDDSLSVRKVAEKFLGALGAQVTLANDGVDALAKLRLGGFDLVFTDLEMPRMHGYELLREVRFIPAFKDLPLIVVTSRSGQKHRAQAEALGANGYLTKPFTQDALQQMLTLHAPALRTP